MLVCKNESESIDGFNEEAETSNLSKIHDFNKTIGFNHNIEESKEESEFGIKKLYDTDSK